MDKKVSKLFGMDATHRFHLLSLNSAMYLWSYASKHHHNPLRRGDIPDSLHFSSPRGESLMQKSKNFSRVNETYHIGP